MRKLLLFTFMTALILTVVSVVAWASENGRENMNNSVAQNVYTGENDGVNEDVYEDSDNDGVDEDVYDNDDAEQIRNELRQRTKNKGEVKYLRERIKERIRNQAERMALWEELRKLCGDPEEEAATVAEMIYDNPQNHEYYKEFAKLWRHRHREQVIAFVYGEKLNFDVPPQLIRARTLMPIRAIAEKLGADVQWDPKTRTITISKGDNKIVLTLDRPNATVNGRKVGLDVPPQVIKGRTMIPLRFVGENLGANVTYIGDAQTVVIN
ncbi:MAG: copper amine oxidase N-terminal domain-containing protein [Bacillota bacterium]